MYGEKRLVIVSILLLIFSNVLVYILFFNLRYKNSVENATLYVEDLFKKKCVENISEDLEDKVSEVITKFEDDSSSSTIPIVSGDNEDHVDPDIDESEIDKTFDNIFDEKKIITGDSYSDLDETGNHNLAVEKIKADIEEDYDDYLILSGTEKFMGDIQLLKDFGLEYKYILVDKYNIYYVYLDGVELDIEDKVTDLGGNIYQIKQKSEIEKNQLFGKSVSFINLPKYKGKLVNMILEVENDKFWLIQLDKNLYYRSKRYIKNLFNK